MNSKWVNLTPSVPTLPEFDTTGGLGPALCIDRTRARPYIAIDNIVIPLSYEGVFTPEQYGAKGDGITDDTNAFIDMNTALTAAPDGSIVELRFGATYLVGRQTANNPAVGNYTFSPDLIHVIDFTGKRVAIVRGNGAKILCNPGLRYGTFGTDGLPDSHGMPYFGPTIASPYRSMINATSCEIVNIENVELDGNVQNLYIGGQWGDTGYQIAAIGVVLQENKRVRLFNVNSHHHGQDGLEAIDPSSADTDSVTPILIIDSEFLYNGRQGFSWVGGKGVVAINSKFSHTGKNGTVVSAPGAGIDFEAEGAAIRRGTFFNCEFVDNTGAAVVSDGTNVAEIDFYNCLFIGTTNWTAYIHPSVILGDRGFRFHDCTFAGALTATGNADAGKAPQFHNCGFYASLARSPTGDLYLPANLMADFGGGSTNILLNNCRWDSEDNPDAVGPYIDSNSIIRDCTFRQTNMAQTSIIQGKFFGRNIIDGFNDPGDTYKNYGELFYNGAPIGQVVTGTLDVRDTTLSMGRTDFATSSNDSLLTLRNTNFYNIISAVCYRTGSAVEIATITFADGSGTFYNHRQAGGAHIFRVNDVEIAGLTAVGFNLVTGEVYSVNNVPVVGARSTGWTADTGTAEKTAHATYAGGTANATYLQAEVTAIRNALQDVSRGQKAIKDALIAHGLIGT